jgi:DNA gyrase subunit A
VGKLWKRYKKEEKMDINTEGQNILHVEINKEVKRSYIEYAMSVIVSRALPDVRDGLKPVHRRILYSMHEDNLTHDKPFRKSATTVGNVLGHYHPHGDAAVYDSMVRLAQPFSLRYPLVDGHGNFGNVDGDGAAAYRYTEARMSKIASEMLTDIEKDVVNFSPNFDNKLKEPDVLPAGFPNLLVNGSVGIAVGMATYIPPHNLNEVIDGAIYLMENPNCEILELMQFIKGPDFPTYATIYGTSGIKQAYLTGKGHVMVRAKYHIEEHGAKKSIVYTEIPYQVNKSNLVKTIGDLVNDKRIEGISDVRDESGRAGMRIVVDLKRDVNEMIIVNLLYKLTQLQDTCAMNMLALVNGEPKTLNLKQMLHYYIKHRQEVVTRRVTFDLNKARAKEHIWQGYKIALDNIDEVISIIRGSKTVAESKENLIARFAFTDIQAQAIVELPLGKLSGMEVENILAELDRLMKLIAELEGILADESKIIAIIRDEMNEIKRRYGDERRTIIEEAENDIVLEDLIERHKCLITTTHDGYIKRLPVDTYEAQNRGGKGINAMKTKEEDSVKDLFVSHSHNYLFMFTNLGRLYIKKCYEIPEGSRTSKGTHINNILPLLEGEKITAFISVAKINTDEVLVMTTEKGMIKRCPLSAFRHIRAKGVIAIKLNEGDNLLYVNKTEGDSEIFVAASNGQALKFAESRVRVMGRTSRGVRAIRLGEGEKVVGCLAIKPDENGNYAKKLLTLTENGFGKRCDFALFAEKNRGGKGMRCHKLTEKTGALAGIAAVDDTDDVMLMTDGGMLIRTVVEQISVSGRSASGVIVMRLADGAKIIGFERIKREEEAEQEALPENDGEELIEVGDDVPEEEEADDEPDEADEADDADDEEEDEDESEE